MSAKLIKLPLVASQRPAYRATLSADSPLLLVDLNSLKLGLGELKKSPKSLGQSAHHIQRVVHITSNAFGVFSAALITSPTVANNSPQAWQEEPPGSS